MKKPKAKRKGKPYCDEEMLYLIYINGGTITRSKLKELLEEEGYSYYCVYEAFRRNEWNHKIYFEGSGHSKYQLVHLKEEIE